MPLMAGAARFCRERQELCHRSESVPQIALLYSAAGHYRQSPSLFFSDSIGVGSLKGVLNQLLDSQYSVDVRGEHHLRGKMNGYPLIVLPQWDYLEPAFREELLAYVKGGGNLLLAGPTIAGLFKSELGVEYVEAAPSIQPAFIAHDGWLGGCHAPWQRVKATAACSEFGRVYEADDFKSASWPAATIAKLGKGRIAAVWLGLGENQRQTAAARDFLAALTRELFPKPMVGLRGSRCVDVSLQRKDGRLLVNLLNTSGPHADGSVTTIGEIDPLGPLDVTLRLPAKPRRVTLEPGGESIDWREENGEIRLTVPRLDIHRVLAVE
jgi:hypothetical protein